MNKQSAFINEESHEKIVKKKEEEKLKELKKERIRKQNCERQRAYYYRQKDLKNEEKKKKKEVPKTNAERQRKFRQRTTEKSYVDTRKCKRIYNGRGHIAATGKDLCDCLDVTCPGCHFPCPKCSSNKCGHECRVNRKWMYDKIEIEGNDFVIKNVYKNK